MWKKDSVSTDAPDTSAPHAAARPERSAAPRGSGERATIGRSIAIKGEVTGDEDLVIQGRIDGSVNLKQHAVTVGPEGEVKASIVGRIVTIEGHVEGNLTAEEQVVLRSSSRVQGDITAPRVVLEDGARFRGGVDMGQAPDRAREGSGGSGPGRAAAVSEPSRSMPESAGTSGSSSERDQGQKGPDDKSAAAQDASPGGKAVPDPAAKVRS